MEMQVSMTYGYISPNYNIHIILSYIMILKCHNISIVILPVQYYRQYRDYHKPSLAHIKLY